jgi:hypothetical protein
MRKISPKKELSTTWEDLKKALLKKVNLLTNGFNQKSSNFDTNNRHVDRDTIMRDQSALTNYHINLF